MKLKKLLSALALGSLAVATAPLAMANTQWDLPLAWPQDNFITKDVQQFADKVAKQTNGDVKITLHPSGSLGFKGPEMFSAVRDGLVPIGDMLLGQQVGEDSRLDLESLPYMLSSFEKLELFDKAYRPLLDDIFAKNNQKVLLVIPWPEQQIFTKKKIKTLADLKGVKIRTYNKPTTEIFSAAGMTTVQLPWGEVVPSLASGAIDAVATSATSAIDGSFWEFLKYAYPTRQAWSTDAVSVNLDYWNQLPKETRTIIEKIATDLQPKIWASVQQIDKDNMKILTDHGMIAGTISNDLRQKLHDLSGPIRDASLKNMGPEVKKVFDDYAALNK